MPKLHIKGHILLIFMLILVLVLPFAQASAYLDPGTGSLLLSSLVAIFASFVYFFKGFFYKITTGKITRKALIGGGQKWLKHNRPTSFKSHTTTISQSISPSSLVIYGEDKRYYSLFKPIIDALEKLQVPYTFYTSDENDPMLEHKSNIAEIKFIGTGTKAAMVLNTLQADICVLTTPQLDVLEIKRSKGVKHYCHILHSTGHIELYEIFAIDYFDSVFVNSPIHTDFIREVEQVRKLKAKQIEIVGCPYLDYLQDKLENLPKKTTQNSTPTILVAPSWGRESILEKYGFAFLEPLLETGYFVIIRPHPQSYISQKDILDDLYQKTQKYKNLKWDNHIENIHAMAESDLMIGDFSGVLFDYIALFNKPLLTMKFSFNTVGYDLEDTSYLHNTWKDSALKDISQSIESSDFKNIKSIIDSALHDKTKLENRKKYKELLWYFPKQGGMQTALKLLQIHKDILEDELGDNLPVHNAILAISNVLNAESALISSTNNIKDSTKGQHK